MMKMKYIVFLMGAVCAWQSVDGSSTDEYRMRLLVRAIDKACLHHGGCSIIQTNPGFMGEPGPVFVPVTGLDDANAIPFLIGIVTDESLNTISDSSKRHLSRCYAIMCLAYTRDQRAVAVLDDILENGLSLDDANTPLDIQREHDARQYAAAGLGLLKSEKTVDALIRELRNENNRISYHSAWALARIGDVKAAKPIIEAAVDARTIDDNTANQCMKALAKTELKATIFMNEGEVAFEDFPELGRVKAPAFARAWRHWIEKGEEHSRATFDSHYALWRTAEAELSAEKSGKENGKIKLMRTVSKRRMSEIGETGVAALPFLMEKIKDGEVELVPIVSRLTDGAVSSSAGSKETLAWWQANKAKWLIFPEEPNKQK